MKTIKKMLDTLKGFTDKNSDKLEIRYVFFDAKERKFVATNGRKLLVVNTDFEYNKNLLIDVNRIGTYGNAIGIAGYAAFDEREIGRYPDYARLMVKNANMSDVIEDLTFVECVMNAGAIVERQIVVPFDKCLSKLDLEQENTRIYHRGIGNPFMVKGLVNFGGKGRNRKMFSTSVIILPKRKIRNGNVEKF